MSNSATDDLHSIQARGQFKREWIYWRAYGRQFKRPYKVPTYQNSPRTESRKAFFRHGILYWNGLTNEEQVEETRKALSIKQGWYGKNYFLNKWLRGKIVMDCIRSLQKGNLLCSDGINNVPIVAVELAKAVVWVSTYAFGSSEGLAKSNGVKGAELTTTTNLAIEAIRGVSAPQPVAYWQVVEYY